MKTLFISVIFSSLTHAAAPLPKALIAIEKKYQSAKTLTTEFEQTTQVALTQSQKHDKGVISFKRPDKMHWQTMEPNPGLLVCDGKTYSIYTPPFDKNERGSVIIKKASEVRSELATQLLSGQFSGIKSLQFKKISNFTFELHPNKGHGSEVKSIILEINAKKEIITGVTLHHLNGNIVLLRFNNTVLGSKLDDSMFRFVPPAGTDTFKE
ncbi:MAG: outer membrane lipoprotein carrier protein LolA [Xanthomonadaceae bacterium]|nr:outer membrane lipoprotein carrier protein LolA [Xanthomonadaceae bacterium]